VLTLRAPARLCPERPVVIAVEGDLRADAPGAADPLNPAVGEVQRVSELR